ncbi:MAG: YdcF family protein [Cyclobacteriaceae bacterium]|nr:YdcF family protein [Cyclobacteriaceae bacterium]
MKRLFRFGLYVLALILTVIVVCNFWIIIATENLVYDQIDEIPYNRVALVLGTSNKLISGDTNYFFFQRIHIAAELYKAGKVQHILVSGSNSSKYYNEPQMMKNALEDEGVPATSIEMDYEGNRTLNSIMRSKNIFGQEKITIVTQLFHSYRALFIGKTYQMDVVAMVPRELPVQKTVKVMLRELLARPVAIWDLFVSNKMAQENIISD